jgi:hypothetical protein
MDDKFSHIRILLSQADSLEERASLLRANAHAILADRTRRFNDTIGK